MVSNSENAGGKLELSELLPHRDPMMLLSGYESQSVENSVTAFVDIGSSSPFYEAALGGVPSCIALEYMSQTMALLVGITRRKRGLEPRIGFVLGSRRLEIHVATFTDKTRYRITATCTYEDEAFGSFDCEIADASGFICAKGTLTAFQPEGDASALITP